MSVYHIQAGEIRPYLASTDDAIAYARESGFTINSICSLDDGLWQVSLSLDPTRTTYKVATGETIAEAILACIAKAEMAEFKIRVEGTQAKVRISLASLGLAKPMRRRI